MHFFKAEELFYTLKRMKPDYHIKNVNFRWKEKQIIFDNKTSVIEI